MQIRPEEPKDYPTVFKLVEQAFLEMQYSSHTEHFIVEKLRKTDAYIPELSLVAEQGGDIVGHIILSKIKIDNGQEQFDALILGPVSVWPELHGQGIGSQLIKMSHKVAKALGHKIVVLLGHKDYYPRFGYKLMKDYGISLPHEATPENCMVIGLTPKTLEGVSGQVIYSKPFME